MNGARWVGEGHLHAPIQGGDNGQWGSRCTDIQKKMAWSTAGLVYSGGAVLMWHSGTGPRARQMSDKYWRGWWRVVWEG